MLEHPEPPAGHATAADLDTGVNEHSSLRYNANTRVRGMWDLIYTWLGLTNYGILVS